MITEVPIAGENETVENIMDRLGKESQHLKTINYIYVVDENERLIGVISIREIFTHPKETELEKIMRRNLITVSPETDEAKVADIGLKHNIKAVPVVKNRKLLGVVPSDRMLSILNRTLLEDIFHFAGIHKSHLDFENTMAEPFLQRIKHRIPWLLVGLFGIILTAGFISAFETTLEKVLILTSFIPAVVYMSAAMGEQTTTLFVRDIAFLGKEIRFRLYFLKQLSTCFVVGLIIGGIVFSIVSVFWGDPFIGFIVALSMIVAFIFSTSSALSIVFTLNKMKLDPALGGGPFATVVSDAMSIVIYLVIATLLLG
ncbi:MAG TPA: CBS domain-containing protein [Candidatus Bathyarchaeia archaeon]|nr:CBS domain-containing protein [Candidatus Bathyarchaeia archaeon]